MTPEILSKGRNSIRFSALDGKQYFYENIFGSIHASDAESQKLKEVIDACDNHNSFSYDSGMLAKKLERLDTLVLNCTEQCNLNCGYCIFSGNYSTERVHNSLNRMSEVTALRAVHNFLEHSIEEPNITFYGGEPLLEQKLIARVIDEARQLRKNPNFAMTTNFTLAAGMLDWLAENGISITVSLDGPKHIHDKWRKNRAGRGSYNKIISNIQYLEQRHPEYFKSKVAISATISSPEKLDELKDFFENDALLSKLPLRMQAVELNFLSSQNELASGFSENNLRKSELLFWEMAEAYSSKIISKANPTFFERALFDMPLYQAYTRRIGSVEGNIFPRGMCMPGSRKLFVGASGEFYMCEKIGKRLNLGNLNSGLKLEKMADALDDFCSIRNNICTDCWAYKDCPSCVVSAKDIEGISGDGLKKNCSRLEKAVFTGIVLYTQIAASLGVNAIEDYFKDYDISRGD